MVINCPECSTKFRVSAEKIPAQGAKLRCARCRHIFFVAPEEETPVSSVNETPEMASPSEESTSSFDTPDLAPPEDSFATEKSPSESDFTVEGNGTTDDDPFADTDFAFEDSSLAADEPAEDEQSAPSFGADNSTDNIDFGFEDEPLAEQKTEATEGSSYNSSEIGAGVDDTFDASAFEDSPPAADDAFSFDEDYGNLDMGDEEDEDQAFTFGDDSDESDNAFTEARPESVDEISSEEAAAGFSEEALLPESFQEEPSPADPYASMEDDYSEKDYAGYTPPKKKRGPFATLILFLLVLILGLVVAGGVLYWQSGPQALLQMVQKLTGQEITTPHEGQILLKDLQGSFVTNKIAGELLVIQGNAVNDYRESRAAIQVKGILFDEQGNQLRQKTIFCGNPISIDNLRKLPYDRLEEIMGNQFGESLVNLNVTPGQIIPFTIVFRDIPGTLSEFVVEVADSNPAAQ